MAATGLDIPVLMSDEHIRQREFVMVRRGYDPAQVRDFLERVADEVREFAAMLHEARLEVETATRSAPSGPSDPYRELADRFAGVLRAADEEAKATRREAEQDAETIVSEARAEAERIRGDAHARAEEMRTEAQTALRDAREQADRTLNGLSARRDTLIDQLAAMQERLIVVARDLESTIETPEAVDPSPVLASSSPSSSDVWATGSEGSLADADADAHDEDAGGGTHTDTAEAPIVIGEAEELFAGASGDAAEPEGDLDDDAQLALVDPTAEGLWDGTDSIGVDIPDIPPLDLDWGDVERDDDR